MTQPFTIEIFATTGDAHGVLTVKKRGKSLLGVAFPIAKIDALSKDNDCQSNNAGVYLLTNTKNGAMYIGEGDTVFGRLKTHATKKEKWTHGVYFVDPSNITKTEVQYLESRLVELAQKNMEVKLCNGNTPQQPSMSSSAKATAEAFLEDVLLILPFLGIHAFARQPFSVAVPFAVETKPLPMSIGKSQAHDMAKPVCGFVLDGVAHSSKNFIAVLHRLLECLTAQDVSFIVRLDAAQSCNSKQFAKRLYVAQSRYALYKTGKSREWIDGKSKPLSCGYWMSTNWNQQSIKEIIAFACEVAGKRLDHLSLEK